MKQYKPRIKGDKEVIEALEKIIAKHPTIGFRQYHYRLRLQGYQWNHKRVYCIYQSYS